MAEPRQARRSSPRATSRRPGSPRPRTRLCGEQPRELSTFSNSLGGAYFTGIKQGSRKHTAFRARPPPPPDLPHRPGSAAPGPWERRRPPGRPRHPPRATPVTPPPPSWAGGAPWPPALARGAEPRGRAGGAKLCRQRPLPSRGAPGPQPARGSGQARFCRAVLHPGDEPCPAPAARSPSSAPTAPPLSKELTWRDNKRL